MRLEAHAIAVELPRGWDGRIHARRELAEASRRPGGGGQAGHGTATLHAASFALPARDGDFGSGATSAMSRGDAFLALTEYLEGDGLRAGRGLFRSGHIPRALQPAAFSPRTLLVGRADQAGYQHFFTAAGRPFCLYAVVTMPAALPALRGLNEVLASLSVDARP